MYYFLDIPFQKTTKAELVKKLSEKGVAINPINGKSEVDVVNIFDMPCTLFVDLNMGIPTFYLVVHDNLTGYNYYGEFSKQHTSDWMQELFKKMKQKYGEPSYKFSLTHIDNADTIEEYKRELPNCNFLNPTTDGESIHVVFDNVELCHQYYKHEGESTSRLSITYRPETQGESK